MKYTIFAILMAVLVLGTAHHALAFTIAPKNLDVGEPILISGAVENNLYSIFWINGGNPHDEACAYIYGRDLTGYFATDSDGITQWVPGDNDLTHYGSCFVNDSGTFKIVELSDQGFTASFPDSLQSDSFVSFDTITVR